jgi:hypothetical protein
LKEVDVNKNNILHLTASYGSKETLKFMFKKLEKIVEFDDIKNFLCILGQCRKNILQSALKQNMSLEVHQFQNL